LARVGRQAASTRGIYIFAAALAEADMTSVVESNRVTNDVLEVDSARGTLKSPRAAALNDGMLAASVKLTSLSPISCSPRLDADLAPIHPALELPALLRPRPRSIVALAEQLS
jgi:hypothetical protein